MKRILFSFWSFWLGRFLQQTPMELSGRLGKDVAVRGNTAGHRSDDEIGTIPDRAGSNIRRRRVWPSRGRQRDPWVIGLDNGSTGTGSGCVLCPGGWRGKNFRDGLGGPWVIGCMTAFTNSDGTRWIEYPGGGRVWPTRSAPRVYFHHWNGITKSGRVRERWASFRRSKERILRGRQRSAWIIGWTTDLPP